MSRDAQPYAKKASNPSPGGYAALSLSAILAMLLAHHLVIAVLEITLLAVAEAAWWPLGRGGSVVLAMCLLLALLIATGANIRPPTKSEWLSDDGQSLDGAIFTRLFCIILTCIILLTIGFATLGIALDAVR